MLRKFVRSFPVVALPCYFVAACATPVPDSAAGVGFGDYDTYQAQREAQLTGAPVATNTSGVSQPVEVQASTLNPDGSVSITTGDLASVAPVAGTVAAPVSQPVSGANGISSENDFDAVSSQRDIEADAALIAQNRAQYTVIQPTALPTRTGTNTPNIVAYALQTNNPVGVSLYSRGSTSASKTARACNAYRSSDAAQEDFLTKGGPERDRMGVDPDGDGFACGWNPTPFRAARGG